MNVNQDGNEVGAATVMENVVTNYMASLSPCGNARCNRHERDRPTRPFRVCGRCRSIKYCSDSCIQGDWINHRLWCLPAEPENLPGNVPPLVGWFANPNAGDDERLEEVN